MRAARLLVLLAAALGARIALADAPEPEAAPELLPAPEGIDAAELSRRAGEAFSGERTYLEAVLSVRERDGGTPKEVAFRAWRERGSGRSFLRVLAPPGRAGTGLLRLPPNLWQYAPAGAAVELVDRDRLGEAWFGSDFALADLIDPPAALGTPRAKLLGIDPAAGAEGTQRAYVLDLRTGEDPGDGRVIAWIETERATPLRCDRRDGEDALLSTLVFDDLRDVKGRAVPHRWTLTRPGAPGRESRIELREIRFDPGFDDAIFSTGQLLQRGAVPAAVAAPDARLGAPGGSPP
jgi:hypothetical protein